MGVYRDNLYIDRDDPIFDGPLFVGNGGRPTKKGIDLASPNSEDAITWSVFRTLVRIPPPQWLDGFLAGAGLTVAGLPSGGVNVDFWPKVAPPTSRLLWLLENLDDPRVANSRGAADDPNRLELLRERRVYYRDEVQKGRISCHELAVLEGETELDAVVEDSKFLVVIEAKYLSDLSPCTRWDTEREQFGRVIDIALELSEAREKPAYTVLITDRRTHEKPLLYETLVPRYQHDPSFLASRLSHRRKHELGRLAGVGWTTWREVLNGVERRGLSKDLLHLLDGLDDYLRIRGL